MSLVTQSGWSSCSSINDVVFLMARYLSTRITNVAEDLFEIVLWDSPQRNEIRWKECLLIYIAHLRKVSTWKYVAAYDCGLLEYHIFDVLRRGDFFLFIPSYQKYLNLSKYISISISISPYLDNEVESIHIYCITFFFIKRDLPDVMAKFLRVLLTLYVFKKFLSDTINKFIICIFFIRRLKIYERLSRYKYVFRCFKVNF